MGPARGLVRLGWAKTPGKGEKADSAGHRSRQASPDLDDVKRNVLIQRQGMVAEKHGKKLIQMKIFQGFSLSKSKMTHTLGKLLTSRVSIQEKIG